MTRGRVGRRDIMADLLPMGTRAPDFRGVDQDGRPVSLGALEGQLVVLYFYPADMTTGCTMEACAFRDNGAAFRDAGAVILGVSVQDEASHRTFRAKHGLDFPLIADTSKEISRAYHALSFLGVSKRATYVIGPDGTILYAIASVNPNPHSREALRVVSEYVTSHGRPNAQAAPGAGPA